MTKFESALRLAAEGFLVFPLVPNGKTPVLPSDWRKMATCDEAKVKELWTEVDGSERDFNIGIALQPHEIVIDVDVRDGKKGRETLAALEAAHGKLPKTYTTTTASGGAHHWYVVDHSGGIAKELGEHVDVKGVGGYVVGPGSTIDGKAYTVAVDTIAANCPAWVMDLARKRKAPKDPAKAKEPLVELDDEHAITRAIDWLSKSAPMAIEGDAGDLTTYKVAARIKDMGVSETQCLDLMIEHWNDQCEPPWDPDDLKQKVRNAYAYGQEPPGVRSAEAEFDAVEIDAPDKPATKRRGLFVVPWKEADVAKEEPYVIDGLMGFGTMVVTYGDSNVGKSYVSLDLAYHIAAGREWNGSKVKQGLVVYVAAEGGQGFVNRIAAYKKRYGVEDIPFALVPCPVDLFRGPTDTNKLIALIREEEQRSGQKCVLVVIDTLARAMAGGDENTATDMGKFVENCDRLRTVTGATVNIIHHTGKDKSKGARGSSALRAATDSEIEIDIGTMSATKQRDLLKAEPFRFELAVVEIGRRSDGKAVTACVVEWLKASEFDERVSPAAERMLSVLEALVAQSRDDGGDGWIEWGEWQMSCLRDIVGPRGGKVSRTQLYQLRQELSHSSKIKKDAKNQWTV